MNTPESVALLGPNDVRELCTGLRIRPTKTLGQNFVTDPNTVRKIAEVAGLTGDEHVIEVGPGLGSLTLALLERGCAVTAVEIDPKLAQFLPQTVANRAPDQIESLALVRADALTLQGTDSLAAASDKGSDPRLETAPTHVVANLPYNVAVPVMLQLLQAFPSIEQIVVMVQAEVADRLSASPGGRVYGVPSAKLAWYGHARRGITISRSVFWPVPNVDSALVVMRRDSDQGRWKAARTATFALINAAFAQRRKTLRAALKRWLQDEYGINTEAANAVYAAAEIDPARRGETLSITEFDALAAAIVAAQTGLSKQ